MKTLTTFLFCLFLSISIFAQIQKGSNLMGGTGSFSRSGYKNYKVTYLSFSPEYGYFCGNRTMLGLALDVLYEHDHYDSGDYGFGINPLVRYYFEKDGAVHLYAQGNIGYQNYYENLRFFNDGAKSLTFGAGIGTNIFIHKSLAIEAAIKYKGYRNYSEQYSFRPNYYDEFNINLGIVMVLENKEKK